METDDIWRVSAATGVGITVLAGAVRIKSAAFGQFAPCTSIRKGVEFPLTGGDYIFPLSGNAGAFMNVMVSPKP